MRLLYHNTIKWNKFWQNCQLSESQSRIDDSKIKNNMEKLEGRMMASHKKKETNQEKAVAKMEALSEKMKTKHKKTGHGRVQPRWYESQN
jgi:hypothetical protein